MGKINLLIIEDDVYWLGIFKEILKNQPDIRIIGEICRKDNLNYFLSTNVKFDVVLLDLELEGDQTNGITTCSYIFHKRNDASIIINISNNENENLIKQAFSAGAIDFVSKKNYKDIAYKIRYANSTFNPYKIILTEYSKLIEESILYKLSTAEKDLYKLICKGYSRANISEIMFKSPNTIKKQIKSILNKTGCKTTKELRELLSSPWKKYQDHSEEKPNHSILHRSRF
ncbi:response regulator transcription factor [Bacillus changyiensis]|uniref:response regulator transcription factor n=1 Tax=Bacillus changyiensis TaxID=3004103 RepID=UPI0022E25878|nr:response regulator [Bacillus changyiensis]MDA1477688.1 response regulator [Bacillus changyiensis]